MKPTLNRAVRFVTANGIECAAIIAKVWSDECVNLAWFDPNGVAGNATSVVLDPDGKKPYSWHWPQIGGGS